MVGMVSPWALSSAAWVCSKGGARSPDRTQDPSRRPEVLIFGGKLTKVNNKNVGARAGKGTRADMHVTETCHWDCSLGLGEQAGSPRRSPVTLLVVEIKIPCHSGTRRVLNHISQTLQALRQQKILESQGAGTFSKQ